MFIVYALIYRRRNRKIAICKTSTQEIANSLCIKLGQDFAVGVEDYIADFGYVYQGKLTAIQKLKVTEQISNPQDWQNVIIKKAKEYERKLMKTLKIKPQFISINDAVEIYHLDKKRKATLAKRLQRLRKKSLSDELFRELSNVPINECRFLYNAKAVHEEYQKMEDKYVLRNKKLKNTPKK